MDEKPEITIIKAIKIGKNRVAAQKDTVLIIFRYSNFAISKILVI